MTVKFVMPKLTVRNVVRKFIGLIYKPASKIVKEVTKEWREASAEEEEKSIRVVKNDE